MLIELSLRRFLEETSAGTPVPGGGSVAALCGALGAALAAMVANLTVHKKGYEQHSRRMAALATAALNHREMLISCMDQDAAAYREVIQAMQLPKDNDVQKDRRKQAVQQALKSAAAVPLQTAREGMALLGILGEVIENGNRNAVSDGAAGVLAVRAAVQAALYNVKINLLSITDKAFVNKTARAAEHLALELEKEEQRILAMVARILEPA